jgi:hypothetical protein
MPSILESLQLCEAPVKILAGLGSFILAKAFLQVRSNSSIVL